MAQTAQIHLSITADASKAKQEFEKLKQSLSETTSGFKLGEKLDNDLKSALNDAMKLEGVLAKATMANGDFNISRFERGLKQAGLSVEKLYSSLSAVGRVDIFNDLALQANAASKKVNVLEGSLQKFYTGLKNTAMWTIQSQAIHAVQSALSGAFSYAQKLNKGLTDIAIVSDLTGTQLAQFAKTANQMAKDLSASTSDVVSGALIYYQAGLSDEEVIKRTETTIKLAQTSGESAEQISSYMTAIWNNFYDGSKSVEYYADAISYLGAVTAASNADIAEGMQAFSAVADTVGLSFEYGASAITLLRDVTQQSASTIGNSLKTIFARLSSVSQGETLEDGVNLTKYSKALETVGVQVIDTAGQLKSMDDILDDLALKWDNLTDAQKVALAQTVGGVRQYNNLISLMDNYEKFQELVAGAQRSDGYLQNQADEYAESWEGARNRLTAAWEKIYSELINDKFFIKLIDFLTKASNLLGDIIEGMGGLPGLLSNITIAISSLKGFGNDMGKIAQYLIEIKDGFTGVQAERNETLQNDMLVQLVKGSNFNEADLSDLLANIEKRRSLLNKGQKQEAGELNSIINRQISALQLKQALEEKSVEITKQKKQLEEEIANINKNSEDKFEDYFRARNYTTLQDTISTYKGFNTDQERQNFLTGIKEDPEKYGIIEGSAVYKRIVENLQDWTEKSAASILKSLNQTFVNYKKSISSFELEEEVAKTAEKTEKVKNDNEKISNEKNDILEKARLITQEEDKQGKLAEDKSKEIKQIDENYKNIETTVKNINNETGKAPYTTATDTGGKDESEAWKVNLQMATRAIGAIGSFNSAINGLTNSFQDLLSGNVDFSSFISRFISGCSSGMYAVRGLASALEEFGIKAEDSFKVASLYLIAFTAFLRTGSWLVQKLDEALKSLSLEGQIASLSEEVENFSNNINEANNKVKDFTSTIEKLDSARVSIALMAKGTDEYTDAIREANKETQRLIDQYDLNPDQYTRTSNGLLKITDIDAIEQQLLEEERKANIGYLTSRQELDKKEQQKAIENTYANETKTSQGIFGALFGLGGAAAGGAVGAGIASVLTSTVIPKLGAVIGTAIAPGIGTAIGGAIGTAATAAFALAGAGMGGKAGYSLGNFTGKNIAKDNHKTIETIGELMRNGEFQFSYDSEKDKSALKEILANQLGADEANLYVEDLYKEDAKELIDALHDLQGSIDQANSSFKAGVENEIVDILNKERGYSLRKMSADDFNYITDHYGEATSERYKQILNDPNFKITDQDYEDYAISQGWTQEEATGKWYNSKNQEEDLDNIKEENVKSFAALNQALNETTQSIQNANFDEILANKPKNYTKVSGDDYDVGREGWKDSEIEQANRYANLLMDIHKAWDQIYDSEKDAQRVAEDLAEDYINFNHGYKDLLDNADSYIYALKNMDESSVDYIDTVATIKHDLELMLEVPVDQISNDFFKNEKAAKALQSAMLGNIDAITDLRELAAEDIFMKVKIDENTEQQVKDEYELILDRIRSSEDWNNLEVGAVLNDEEFVNALNDMLDKGLITVTDLNNILNTIGWEPQIEWDEMSMKQALDLHKTAYLKGEDGSYTSIDNNANVDLEEKVWVPKLVANGQNGATHWKGSPNNLTNSSNRQKANKNSNSNGGGHHRTPKAKDEDRYHEINQQLKQTQHELNKVNALKERAYGQNYLDALDKEIKLLEQEADQYKQMYQEAEMWYAKDKSALIGFGAKFNSDGTIDNYQAWQASWIDRYNNESISEEEFGAWQKAVQKYEDSLAHLNEAEENYIKRINEIYDKHLEKVVYKVKYLNELIQISTDYLDYLIEKLDEDMYDTAETVAKIGEKASNVLKEIGNVQEGIVKALTQKDNHPKMTEDLINGYLKGEVELQKILDNISQLPKTERDQLKEWMGELIEYNKELRKLQKDAYDKIIESIEEFNDKINRQQNIVNDTVSVMEHYANIIDIIGKDTIGISNAMMNALNDLQVTGAQANLTIATNQLNQNKAILEEIQKNLEEAREKGTESDVKLFEEKLEQQEDIVRELAEEWASAYEDALKSAQDAFTNGVKLATEAFDKAVSGSIGSLDKLQDFYDKQTTLQDIFLPDYERIHDLSKLARDINNAINATDNIKGKERLRNLQNEILEAQREGTELSKYDMEFMQKRFELEQAQIAMEEQRNAKNLVRMTRDNEGNWSYTYTQNPENVAKAQQEFEDKLYELEKLNQDRVKETQQLMLNAMEKFRDEIANADMNDQEKTQALLDYWRQLQEEYGNLTDTALKNGSWITDTYDVSNHELTDSFEETLLSLGTGYQTLEDFMNDFRSASATMGDDVAAQYQKWGDYVKAITEAAGINFDNFAQRVADDMDLVIAAMIGEDGNGGAVGVAKQLADEMGISVDDILKELEGWWNGPEGRSILMEAEIEENEKTYEQLEKLIANADQIPVELPKISQAVAKIASGGNECGCGATCTTTCWTDCGSNGASAPRPKGCGCGSNCSGGCDGKCYSYCSGSCVAYGPSGDPLAYVDLVKNGKGYATGGYTGGWGSDGKLAILHEKELVLNKEDTANMLATVGFVRDLVEMIGVNATSAGGIGNLLLGGVASGGNYLDQNVNIHAEFPNATDHNEIEEAFQNLIGLAGQYAGRKQ